MATANWVPLVEIQLGSGTIYKSTGHIRHPTRFYAGEIETIGTITREIAFPPTFPAVGNLRMTLADKTHQWSKTLADEEVAGTLVPIKFGQIGDSEASFSQVYQGEIIRSPKLFTNRAEFDIRDITFDPFRDEVAGRITKSAFPNKPPAVTGIGVELQSWTFRPIIFGEVSSQGKTDDGFLPCPYVYKFDGVKSEYVVAQHACKSVLNVYRYGIKVDPGQYTIVTETIAGRVHTLIRFTTDQEDEVRFGETTITADVQGFTSDGPNASAGTLVTNPVTVIEKYVDTFIDGLSSTDFATLTAHETSMDDKGYVTAGAIVRQIRHSEVIGRLMTSFNLSMFVNFLGKIDFNTDGTSEWIGATGTKDDLINVLEDSYEQISENELTRINYGFDYNFNKDFFFNRPTLINSEDETALGKQVAGSPVNLFFVQNSTVAMNVIAERQGWLGRRSPVIKINVPITEIVGDELGATFLLTHFRGENTTLGAGWVNQPFRILSMRHNFSDFTCSIVAQRAPLTSTTRLPRLGDRGITTSTYPSASAADQDKYLYLCDRTDGQFAGGDLGKRLASD